MGGPEVEVRPFLGTQGVHPDKEPLLFPAGSRIVRRRHAVSDRYKEYLRGVLSETEWRGGFFDVERENATGNMSEGALGFFAVTSVTIDTIYVQ